MAGVIGIGGIFMKFKEPKKMHQWYTDVLGMTTNDYGVLFEFGGKDKPKGYLQLGTFENNTDYFGLESQQYMINFRVDNIEELKNHLSKNKVNIVDTIETYSYGKISSYRRP